MRFFQCFHHVLFVADLPIQSKFDNPNDYEGWTCGGITACGDFGNLCGGYDTTARGDYIQRTYMLPAGKRYYVTMDFIQIDSWFVWWTRCCGAWWMHGVAGNWSRSRMDI